jgi:hypothetical protein
MEIKGTLTTDSGVEIPFHSEFYWIEDGDASGSDHNLVATSPEPEPSAELRKTVDAAYDFLWSMTLWAEAEAYGQRRAD